MAFLPSSIEEWNDSSIDRFGKSKLNILCLSCLIFGVEQLARGYDLPHNENYLPHNENNSTMIACECSVSVSKSVVP